MKIQRCPECGIRLKTNYCDICMKRVPFTGVPAKQTFQHIEGSSAHREENHDCIDFDEPVKKKKTTGQIHFPRKKATVDTKKKSAVIGIILAALSVITPLFGLVEEAVDSVPAPEPVINVQDGFVEAGELGAEGVPGVTPGEIYNANGIRITVDDAGLSYGDYAIFLTIYNDTDRDVSVNADWFSVNGYMYSYGLYQDLEAGESAQTYMTFYEDELEKAYIEKVASVAFELSVYDADSYEDIIVKELVTLETDIAEGYEQPVSAYGWELYNDGDICVLIRDMQMDGYGDGQMELHMENLSDSTVSVYMEGIWVNGQEADGYMWNTLRPGTCAVDNVYLYELEEMGITQWDQVDEMTMELYVEYMDGWDILETKSEAITFNPQEIQ